MPANSIARKPLTARRLALHFYSTRRGPRAMASLASLAIPTTRQYAAAIDAAARLAALKALKATPEFEAKHSRDEDGKFTETSGGSGAGPGRAPSRIPRDEYIAETRGPESGAASRASYAVQAAEEAAAGIGDAAENFVDAASKAPDVDDDDDDDETFTALQDLALDLRGAGVRLRGPLDADRISDWLRGGIFPGGELSHDQLAMIWDRMERLDESGAVEALRERLGDEAVKADAETRQSFERTDAFGRGMSIDEFRKSAETGLTVAQGGRDFVSLSADPGVAAGYAHGTDAHGAGVVVEYDGDAVRESGKARPVEYHYMAQDGAGNETWDSDLPLAVAGQLDIRLRNGVPLDRLRPRRVVFAAEPTSDDLARARRMVGPDGAVDVLDDSGA